jgi:hypothetical protein
LSSCSVFTISLPLVLAQAGKSVNAPGSVVWASITSPTSTSYYLADLDLFNPLADFDHRHGTCQAF